MSNTIKLKYIILYYKNLLKYESLDQFLARNAFEQLKINSKVKCTILVKMFPLKMSGSKIALNM
jgi:hypothetical protein